MCECVSECPRVWACKSVRESKICVHAKTHKRLKRTLFYVDKTKEDENFQRSPLFQATDIIKTNNTRKYLSAVGWEDFSSYLGYVYQSRARRILPTCSKYVVLFIVSFCNVRCLKKGTTSNICILSCLVKKRSFEPFVLFWFFSDSWQSTRFQIFF